MGKSGAAHPQAGSKQRRRGSPLHKLGCFSATPGEAPLPKLDRGLAQDGSEDAGLPTHLVVMINGIIGSAGNWKFAAKQFVKRHPQDVLVLRSRCNYNTLTFDGVDVMGERLAKEVLLVIGKHQHLKKISFVGHSLGGLIARYAIAKLYGSEISNSCCINGSSSEKQYIEEQSKGRIAGLLPMNFVTFATPHLGTRWHKQVPIFCGIYAIEKMARKTSPVFGRSGRHLFLCDKDDGKPPLLLRMANDTEDLKFISALRSFGRRVVYANSSSDFVVGWKTSSIRHSHELPTRQQFRKDSKYPHVVHVEISKAVDFQTKTLPATEVKHNEMEEAMIQGLNQVDWERVDVSFRKSKQRFLAHDTIQVKTYFLNSDGADVINHMLDNFVL